MNLFNKRKASHKEEAFLLYHPIAVKIKEQNEVPGGSTARG